MSAFLIVLCVFFFFVTAMAVDAAPIPKKMTVIKRPSSKETMTVYCPPFSALKKSEDFKWTADNNSFRSYDISLSTSVDQFVGAQWKGANVGQIICIYKSSEMTFPILLAYHTITLSPINGKWSKNLGGYKNCDNSNPKKCPFIIRLKPKKKNVYQELKSFKSDESLR